MRLCGLRVVLQAAIGDGLPFDLVAPHEDRLAAAGPRICNTDQGSQFTSAAFTGTLSAEGIRISMDDRGRWLDTVFIERLWRSLKYEDVYLRGRCLRPRGTRRHRLVDRLLQWTSPASGAGQPDTHGGVA